MQYTKTNWDSLGKLNEEDMILTSKEVRHLWLSLSSILGGLYYKYQNDEGKKLMIGDVMHEGGHWAGLMVNYEDRYERHSTLEKRDLDNLKFAIYKIRLYVAMAEYIIEKENIPNAQID